MESINILMEEHKNILKLTQKLEKYCAVIIENDFVDIEKFKFMVEFARIYGDKLHHQKEEDILFKEMEDTLGPTAHKLIRSGMFVEHDLGRLYVSNINNAIIDIENNGVTTQAKLNIIGNSIAYKDLLIRHIDKEDDAVYQFALSNLSEDSKDKVEILSSEFDSNEDVMSIREELLRKLNNL